MEYCEYLALESTPLKPRVWLLYVDDTVITCPQKKKIANTASPCELNKAIHLVHNAKE